MSIHLQLYFCNYSAKKCRIIKLAFPSRFFSKCLHRFFSIVKSRNQQSLSTKLISVFIHTIFLYVFFVKILPIRVFFFHRNQEAIDTHKSWFLCTCLFFFYFLISNISIQDAAKPRTTKICLFFLQIWWF